MIQLCFDSHLAAQNFRTDAITKGISAFYPPDPEFCNPCFHSLKLALNRLFCSFRPVGSPN